MKKIIALSCAVLALGFAASAKAETAASTFPGAFTANIALTSDYTFRGISQSDEGPAVQGGFDYTYGATDSLPVGLYAGIWASNVDFNDGDEASIETDLYAGVQGSIAPIASDWKLGAIYYAYPGADSDLNYDYWEVAASLSHNFGPFTATGSFNYSPEFFGDTGDAEYTALGVAVPLPYDFSLNGHVGYQAIDDGVDYWDWSAGVGYTWNGFNLSLNYVDTDLSEPDECLDGCSERVVFAVSRSF